MNDTPKNTKAAFLFPGQGAQHVGMGKDLYEAFPAARRVFDLAENITGKPLKKLCFDGPEDQLANTEVCQPAIFTVSAAALAVMDELLGPQKLQALRPSHLAGLSLGEYTALYAAESMDFQTALKLVACRGQLMQQAALAVPGGMVSVLGLDEAKAQELCRAAANGRVLSCANFNCPGQVVLSGEIDACRRVEQLAKDFGASGVVPLKVAGAYHSGLMAAAAEKLAEALAKVEFRAPKAMVISNVDAKASASGDEIRRKLLQQLTSPVRWQQSMENVLAQGVADFLEIGPGKVLAGLMRRIDRNARVTCVNSREAIEKLAQ